MPPHSVLFKSRGVPCVHLPDCNTPNSPGLHTTTGYLTPCRSCKTPSLLKVSPMTRCLSTPVDSYTPSSYSRTPHSKHSIVSSTSKLLYEDEYYRSDKFIPTEKTINKMLSVDLDELCNKVTTLTSEKNWLNVGQKNGVQIERNKLGVIRGTIDIPYTNNLTIDFISNLIWETNSVEYNSMIEFATRLLTINKCDPVRCIIYQSYYGLFGAPGRDFIFFISKKKININHYVIACQSLSVPEIENGKKNNYLLSNKVRGECIIGGYEIKKNNNNDFTITCIWNLELNTSLPKFIVNQASANSVHHLSNLRNYILKKNEKLHEKYDEVVHKRKNKKKKTLFPLFSFSKRRQFL